MPVPPARSLRESVLRFRAGQGVVHPASRHLLLRLRPLPWAIRSTASPPRRRRLVRKAARRRCWCPNLPSPPSVPHLSRPPGRLVRKAAVYQRRRCWRKELTDESAGQACVALRSVPQPRELAVRRGAVRCVSHARPRRRLKQRCWNCCTAISTDRECRLLAASDVSEQGPAAASPRRAAPRSWRSSSCQPSERPSWSPADHPTSPAC